MEVWKFIGFSSSAIKQHDFNTLTNVNQGWTKQIVDINYTLHSANRVGGTLQYIFVVLIV